jgi:hypothetical protein
MINTLFLHATCAQCAPIFKAIIKQTIDQRRLCLPSFSMSFGFFSYKSFEKFTKSGKNELYLIFVCYFAVVTQSLIIMQILNLTNQ